MGFAKRPLVLYSGMTRPRDYNCYMHREFLEYSTRKLRQMEGRIESCLGELTEAQVWTRASENENAVGNLVLHLCGNVRQWIVAGVGGAADIRRRDEEFAAREGVSIPQLIDRLRMVVAEATDVIDNVPLARLTQHVVIQSYDVTTLEAIYHVVEHFSGHTGQIIFATKLLTSRDLGFHHHLRTTDPHSQPTP